MWYNLTFWKSLICFWQIKFQLKQTKPDTTIYSCLLWKSRCIAGVVIVERCLFLEQTSRRTISDFDSSLRSSAFYSVWNEILSLQVSELYTSIRQANEQSITFQASLPPYVFCIYVICCTRHRTGVWPEPRERKREMDEGLIANLGVAFPLLFHNWGGVGRQ